MQEESTVLHRMHAHDADMNRRLVDALFHDNPNAFDQSEIAFLLNMSHQRISAVEDEATAKLLKRMRAHGLEDPLHQ